jgi:hypothetical protein
MAKPWVIKPTWYLDFLGRDLAAQEFGEAADTVGHAVHRAEKAQQRHGPDEQPVAAEGGVGGELVQFAFLLGGLVVTRSKSSVLIHMPARGPPGCPPCACHIRHVHHRFS